MKNKRRISVLVTAQTLWHLQQAAAEAGHQDPGKVIDQLVRDDRYRKTHNKK